MLTIDKKKCNGCGICSVMCPASIIRNEDGMPQTTGDAESLCFRCGHCEAYCPQEAVSLDYPDARTYAGSTSTPVIKPEQIGHYLAGRRSVRHFRDTPVNRNTMEKLMEIVRFAPSATNAQSVEWIIITDRKKLDEIIGSTAKWIKATFSNPSGPAFNDYLLSFVNEWEKGRDLILRGAPCLAVAHENTQIDSQSLNGVIAASYFDTAAPAFGIGTCWAGVLLMAAAASAEFRSDLMLPNGHTATAALMFGYPQYKAFRPPKRNTSKVIWI